MRFKYERALCQNLRKALRLEWLETNGCGDYASSSIEGCNTRKYHGLFVADLERPAGRHVLLSTLEETLVTGKAQFIISSRQHPGCFYPKGHEYLREMTVGAWPRFLYRMGDIMLTREVMMPRHRRAVLIRYSLKNSHNTPSARLIIKPLLAYRGFHELTHANLDLQVRTYTVDDGFKIQPYEGMPEMYMQTDRAFRFYPAPDWYRNVEYLVERERGFPFTEDLFQPGEFEIVITPEHPVILSASLELLMGGEAETLWAEESSRRIKAALGMRGPIGHLTREGEKFLVDSPTVGKSVIAGYPWFDSWGRDTMISLPGLTFYAGRPQEGVDILVRAAKSMKDGLIPNCYGPNGVNSYNSADASLWYIWAVQQMMTALKDEGPALVKNLCWQSVKEIISAYSHGRATGTTMDEAGLLHVGSPSTQLTWMDANVNGKPVTPRWGCPVEINALWFNALVFADRAAKMFGEELVWSRDKIVTLKKEFQRRFWDEDHGYLADVWRENDVDWSFRPNQIFAASLPEPILDRPLALGMMGKIRQLLLTPYGLRTLAPANPDYKSLYEGGPEERDSAYHQGTVWPWLLGAYADALLYVRWDKDMAATHFLTTITPLFATHLRDYGSGSICEIFDAAPPMRPNGCIAQAWSVGEVLRALKRMQVASPGTYRRWAAKIKEEV